jgi:phosphoribosylaminoimidazole carboxylase
LLIEAANRLNIQANILDAPGAPAKQISAHDGHVAGSFQDADVIQQLAKTCDVVTVEIEHVDTDVLAEIEQTVAGQHAADHQGQVRAEAAPARARRRTADSVDLEGRRSWTSAGGSASRSC